jgi:hypothetical protein
VKALFTAAEAALIVFEEVVVTLDVLLFVEVLPEAASALLT